jgi:hypothetical protein
MGTNRRRRELISEKLPLAFQSDESTRFSAPSMTAFARRSRIVGHHSIENIPFSAEKVPSPYQNSLAILKSCSRFGTHRRSVLLFPVNKSVCISLSGRTTNDQQSHAQLTSACRFPQRLSRSCRDSFGRPTDGLEISAPALEKILTQTNSGSRTAFSQSYHAAMLDQREKWKRRGDFPSIIRGLREVSPCPESTMLILVRERSARMENNIDISFGLCSLPAVLK